MPSFTKCSLNIHEVPMRSSCHAHASKPCLFLHLVYVGYQSIQRGVSPQLFQQKFALYPHVPSCALAELSADQVTLSVRHLL